jgi:HPt (histidine-containing phosphotransfer) domain-containing protein
VTSERLGKLRLAIKKGEFEEIRLLAHTAAGGAGTFGARPLYALLKKAEEMARGGKLKSLRLVLRDIEKEWKLLDRELRPDSPNRSGRLRKARHA